MYREHTNNSDTTTPLLQQETDHSQELPAATTTNNNNNYLNSRRDPWLNKLCPSRINPTNEEEDDGTA